VISLGLEVEMKVVRLQTKQTHADKRAQRKEIVLDVARLLAGAALILLAQTLLLCALTGQLLPLYLIACNDGLGLWLGWLLFNKSAVGFLSCVPHSRLPHTPSGARIFKLKKAA
jgi:hypothetical protein